MALYILLKNNLTFSSSIIITIYSPKMQDLQVQKNSQKTQLARHSRHIRALKGPWTPKLTYCFPKRGQFSENFDSNIEALSFVNMNTYI